VLDRRRKGRAFRRITGAALTTLLGGGKDVPEKELGDVDAAPPAPAEHKHTVSAASEDLENGRRDTTVNEGVDDEGDATGDAVNGDNS